MLLQTSRSSAHKRGLSQDEQGSSFDRASAPLQTPNELLLKTDLAKTYQYVFRPFEENSVRIKNQRDHEARLKMGVLGDP